jgi:hypothetical protein
VLLSVVNDLVRSRRWDGARLSAPG